MKDRTTWDLDSPGDYAAAYALIRDALARRVVGHSDAVSTLSLAGVRHVAGMSRQRLLLVGPSGCGKSTLTRALAETLLVPWLLIDVTMMSEQNWAGGNLSDFLSTLFREHAARSARAVVVLDELDKVCAAGFERTSREYRIGKQQSLLPLLGTGSEIPIPGDIKLRPDHMLVIGSGVFAGLPPGPVGPGDLLRLGLMHEIVERMRSVIRLEPLPMEALMEVLRAGMREAGITFRRFGWALEVPRETLVYVASAVARGDDEAGPRSGVSWLRAAADRLLVRMFEQSAEPDTLGVLHPDDVRIPRRRPADPESGGGAGRPPVSV